MSLKLDRWLGLDLTCIIFDARINFAQSLIRFSILEQNKDYRHEYKHFTKLFLRTSKPGTVLRCPLMCV